MPTKEQIKYLLHLLNYYNNHFAGFTITEEKQAWLNIMDAAKNLQSISDCKT